MCSISFVSITCLISSHRFALLSVVLGFTVNTARLWSQTVTDKPSTTSWVCGISHTINYSSVTSPKATDPNELIVTSSMRDLALAILNPGSSLSMQGSAGQVISEPAKVVSDHSQINWFEKKIKSKDLIARPAPPAPAVQHKGESSVAQVASSSKDTKRTSSDVASDVVSAISLRIPDSISPLFDFKNVMEAAEIDTAEIMAALDNLAAAISKQTSTILEKSLDTAQVLRDGLKYRNARAKGKAKELRDVGEQLVLIAEAHIKSRAGRAKVKAMALRERYLNHAGWGAATHAQKPSEGRSGRKKGKKARHGHRKTRKLFCGGF